MDAQAQDAMCVSEKEQQLTAPPGWTKKLVPASAKSITLRKYDVVFIAPDGQEVKSKWHLNRYLKAHPEGPPLSEFIWSTGEEAPVRRSTRFATKEASEDNKSTSRKKGKRNAAEMEAEEIDHDEVETASRKRVKKAGKSEASDEINAVEDPANDLKDDEVMHEVIASDNEATQAAALCDEVQKNENLAEVEASKETVSEKATDEGLNKQEKASASSATIGGEHEDIQLKDEGLTKQVEAEQASASIATIGGEHEDIQLKDEGLNMQVEAEKATVSSEIIAEVEEKIQVEVTEVTELLRDNGLHAENEQETDTLVVHAEEFEVEEVAMETEVMEVKETQETDTLVLPAEDFKVEEVSMETEVTELNQHFDQTHEENEDISCKIAVVTPGVEEVAGGNDKPSELVMQKEAPLESPTPKEDSVEPLMQKEEQERLTHIQNSPLKGEHMRDKSPSEFSSSPVTVTVANE